MNDWRIPTLVNTALIAIALVGGAFLWAETQDAAKTNTKFICAFGHAIGAEPIKQREAETDMEFRQRVALIRQFMAELGDELEDCDVPTELKIDPSSKDVLGEVDGASGDSPPSRPSPSPGGRGKQGPQGEQGPPGETEQPVPGGTETPNRPSIGQGVGQTVDGLVCQVAPQNPNCS